MLGWVAELHESYKHQGGSSPIYQNYIINLLGWVAQLPVSYRHQGGSSSIHQYYAVQQETSLLDYRYQDRILIKLKLSVAQKKYYLNLLHEDHKKD